MPRRARPLLLAALLPATVVLGAVAAACGSDATNNGSFGNPPDASTFDPGKGGSGGYGYGDAAGGPMQGQPEAGPPQCADADKLCAETFTYPYNGEQSVELRGDYRGGAWMKGDAM